MLLSVREYANLRGVSHTAVNKAIRAGKIPLVDGKIDPDVADSAWKRNRDQRQPSKIAGTSSAAAAAVREAGPQPGTFAHAQLLRETANAKRAAIEVQRMEGKLIPKEVVAKTWESLIMPAKTRLLALGAKVAPHVAIETDASKCQALIDAAVYEALSEVSGYRPNA